MNLTEMGKRAETARYSLQSLAGEKKNRALLAAADLLVQESDQILAANAVDIKNGEEKGMHPGMIDRLRLSIERIADMAEGLRSIAGLSDSLLETIETFERPNGLKISKVRVPLGVIGIIYESRPNVTADAFGLCFKTGNAVILKGGSDAIHSNTEITKIIRQALINEDVAADALQLITDTDRKTTEPRACTPAGNSGGLHRGHTGLPVLRPRPRPDVGVGAKRIRHPAPGLCVCVGVHRGFPFGEPYSQTAARHRERAQPQPARPCGRSHFPRGTVDSDCKRMPQRLFPARAAEPFRLSRQFPPVESMDIESRSRDRGLYREPINRAERY